MAERARATNFHANTSHSGTAHGPSLRRGSRNVLAATLTSVLAPFAPQAALACTSPNNTDCTLTTSVTNASSFDNGVSSAGTVTIDNNGVFNNSLNFFNGRSAAGTVTINDGGTFNNNSGGNFYNDLNATGTVAINDGGIFNNNSGGNFFNGNSAAGIVTINDGGTFNNNSGGIFSNGNSAAGTVTINDGGIFNNNSGSTFNNGLYGVGAVAISDGGTFINADWFYNGTYAAGTVTIDRNAVFTNSGWIENGFDAAGTLMINDGGTLNNTNTFINGFNGAGVVTINAGGTFNNAAGGTVRLSNTTGSSFSNAGTFVNEGTLSGYGGTFSNLAGGLFNNYAGNAIAGIDVLHIDNAGTFNIGYGNANLATTSFTGNYTQSATGTLAIRADWATDTSDRLAVTGNATLAGTVVVTPLNFPSTPKLTKTFADIVTTTGTLDASALTATSTAVVSYTLDKHAQAVDLIAKIDFQGGGQTGGGSSQVGGSLNHIYGGSTTLGFMPALMGLATNAELANALDQLSPSGDGAANAGTLQTSSTFAQHLLSCRTTGEGDAYAVIREGQCVWVRGTVRHTSIDKDSGFSAKETAPFVSAGAQFNLGGPWRAGGGIGYESANLRSGANSETDTDRLHLGGVVKYNPGPLLLALSVTGGFGWSDVERHVGFGTFAGTATADYDSDFIAGRFTAAYLLPFSGFYVKPQIEVANTYLSRDGYTERGPGGIALAVADTDDNVWTVSPAVEFGTQIALESGGIARPFIRTGLTWRSEDTFVTSAVFADAPGSAPFSVASNLDDVTFDFAAGVDLITAGDTAFRIQYDGQFGDTVTLHAGSAKLSVRF